MRFFSVPGLIFVLPYVIVVIVIDSEGSVIVSFELYFKTAVTTNKGLAKLIDAAKKENIGPYQVGTLSVIQDKNPAVTPSSPISTTLPSVPPGEDTTPTSSGDLYIVCWPYISKFWWTTNFCSIKHLGLFFCTG